MPGKDGHRSNRSNPSSVIGPWSRFPHSGPKRALFVCRLKAIKPPFRRKKCYFRENRRRTRAHSSQVISWFEKQNFVLWPLDYQPKGKTNNKLFVSSTLFEENQHYFSCNFYSFCFWRFSTICMKRCTNVSFSFEEIFLVYKGFILVQEFCLFGWMN